MNTRAMTTVHPNGQAPDGVRYKLGAKGGKVAQAWQYVWDRLNTTDWQDSNALADEAGKKFKILPDSVLAHLHRMRKEGFLEHEIRSVATEVTRGGRTFTASRKRTHYRIAPGQGEK